MIVNAARIIQSGDGSELTLQTAHEALGHGTVPGGIEPDAKIALEWYGRAAQKGHDAADARASELERLSKR